MDSIERIIRVSWRHRVVFTDDVFGPANATLRDLLHEAQDTPKRVLLVLDSALQAARPGLAASIEEYFKLHPEAGNLCAPPMVLPGGEEAKSSWALVSEIHSAIDREHIDRHSYVIAVGGGAILDLAGLAAATAHRGVRHIRIPTTTLSQCDSGVGVKNGINAFGKKNFVGTFAPPFAVINDFQLLSTLPAAEKIVGLVEAVKVACIRSPGFFEEIEHDADSLLQLEAEPMRRVIRKCAELHLNHIADSGDPFESGSARPLDFGHWSAHKLEQLSRFTISHGEAVAIGIALDVIYSRRAGYLDGHSAQRVLALLDALGLEVFSTELLTVSRSGGLAVLEGLEEFREHLGGKLSITLLRAIGDGFEVNAMNSAMVEDSIRELENRSRGRTLQTA